ncbi:MAG TPA: hemolysin family protein [Defluviitoga sp.]|nr:hemolysin family protein [Defluviitoga sp.]HOP24217.1 hemolysin family protein [Defluviitoga sp.]HPZ28191.1 hemolysin family protein [Defluviitoga sp.]HQD62081.1 hemolysin family protein [Defluviitoga sp.]
MDDPGSLWIYLIFLIMLLSLSGFFSASETALTAIGRYKIRELIDGEKNEKKRKKYKDFIENPNHYLTTILVMNNIVNILATSMATVFAVKVFPSSHGAAVGIVTGIMTLLILIFGEITPKVYAREISVKIFNISFPIIYFLNKILSPIVWLLVSLSNIVIKTFGGETIKNAPPLITENEIISYLDISHEEGVIEKSEKYLMQRSLEMKDTAVKEIMTPRVDIVAIENTETVEELIKIINEEGYSRIPVYRETLDNIVGIVYAKDIFKKLEELKDLEKLMKIRIAEIMRRPFFVPLTMNVKDVFKLFLNYHTHIAIVVDEYGGTAGLVTLEDIIEEMTGEIFDEYDDFSDEINIKKIEENSILVDGSTPINDIERELDIDFPETEFETIGGFLLEHFKRFPKPGEKLFIDNYEFEVISVTVNKIDKVKITIHPEQKLEERDEKKNDESNDNK